MKPCPLAAHMSSTFSPTLYRLLGSTIPPHASPGATPLRRYTCSRHRRAGASRGFVRTRGIRARARPGVTRAGYGQHKLRRCVLIEIDHHDVRAEPCTRLHPGLCQTTQAHLRVRTEPRALARQPNDKQAVDSRLALALMTSPGCTSAIPCGALPNPWRWYALALRTTE